MRVIDSDLIESEDAIAVPAAQEAVVDASHGAQQVHPEAVESEGQTIETFALHTRLHIPVRLTADAREN